MFAIITVLRAVTILVTMAKIKINTVLATILATKVANLASCVWRSFAVACEVPLSASVNGLSKVKLR